MRVVAYRLFLLFVISWFLHLSERVEILGLIRFDLVLVALIAILISAGTPDGPVAVVAEPVAALRIRRLMIILLAYATVTLPLVEWPGSVLNAGLPGYIKALVFYYFTSKLITSPERIRGLLVVFVAAMLVRVFEPVYLHVTTGYWGSLASMGGDEFMDRLAGAPFDKINPNGLAFVVLTVLCFMHYLAPLSRLAVVGYLLSLPVLLWALLLTGSRSGMVGFMAVIGVVWWKSRHKVVMGVSVAVLTMAVAPLLSDDLADRYRSIFDSHTKNSATAEGRIAGVWKDLDVAMRRPLFGHGLGTSREANANFGGEDMPSHNLYTETAQELGFVGLTIFVTMVVAIVATVRSSLATLRGSGTSNRLLLSLADVLQVWLAMNLLFSFASYGLSSYEWYFAAGLSEVLSRFAALEALPSNRTTLLAPTRRALEGMLAGNGQAPLPAFRPARAAR